MIRLGLRVFSVALGMTVLLAGCGGDGNSDSDSGTTTGSTGENTGGENQGVFPGFTGDLHYVVENPALGIGDGADGQGGIAIGSNSGQIRDAEVVVFRLSDGSEIGRASTGSSGLVTVRPGDAFADGIAIEIRGTGNSDYYDIARGDYLPFPQSDCMAHRCRFIFS